MQPRITQMARIKNYLMATANFANYTKSSNRVILSTAKNLLRLTQVLLFIMFTSCGNWGWESIETDDEEQLNVFGLISLDDSLKSFIIVHKTLPTSGPDQIAIGEDEYGYTLYESLYLVKDAVVTVSDGNQSFSFAPNPSNSSEEYYWYSDIFSDPAIYMNLDDSFIPQADMEYSLLVTTPDGLELTGTVTTPPTPVIKEIDLADTVSIKNLFQVGWQYAGDYSATITTDKTDRDGDNYICGMNQFGILTAGDTTWSSYVDSWCYENNNPDFETTSAPLDIRLRFIDENYYKYFLATGNGAAEISNFLIGTGGIGSAYGVEGGFGVFGAISADWTRRIATP